MGKNKKKEKREKITYVDDGRTLSDMSGTSRGMFSRLQGKKNEPKLTAGKTPWQTYRESVRMMFVPMLVVIAAICVVFLIMYFLMRFA